MSKRRSYNIFGVIVDSDYKIDLSKYKHIIDRIGFRYFKCNIVLYKHYDKGTEKQLGMILNKLYPAFKEFIYDTQGEILNYDQVHDALMQLYYSPKIKEVAGRKVTTFPNGYIKSTELDKMDSYHLLEYIDLIVKYFNKLEIIY